MRLLRFLVDIFLFWLTWAWPPVLLVYIVLHFRYPHLVRMTKRLDEWDTRANIDLYTSTL